MEETTYWVESLLVGSCPRCRGSFTCLCFVSWENIYDLVIHDVPTKYTRWGLIGSCIIGAMLFFTAELQLVLKAEIVLHPTHFSTSIFFACIDYNFK